MIKLLDILKEAKQVGDIYHYTVVQPEIDLNLLSKILKSGKLKPSNRRLEKLGLISFSRDRALGHTLGSSRLKARITIDGDKLSNKYKIVPYAQLEPETEYDKENWVAPFSRSTQDSESELVIPAKKYGGSIDILPYIKKIDVLDFNYNKYSAAGADFIKAKKEIQELCDQLNIPVEFHSTEYKDLDDYWSPSKYTKPVK
jgi:hypothetical protein